MSREPLVVSSAAATIWRTPIIPGTNFSTPLDKVLFMVGQMVKYPKNHCILERRFWLSPFISWQVKHLYATILYGVIGNGENNAAAVDLALLLAMTGYGDHPKRMQWIIAHMIDKKYLGAKIIDERPPRILVAITRMHDLPAHYLAHIEYMEVLMDGAAWAAGKIKGEIDFAFMSGVWDMTAAGRKRILTPEQYELRRKALRLQLAQKLQIIMQNPEPKEEGPDDGGAAVLDMVRV